MQPMSLVKRVSSLDIPDGKIKIGQGEYIVYHNFPDGENKELTQETYKKVYKVLNEYRPAEMVKRNSDTSINKCNNRYSILHSKIKEIDPTLDLVFVPRTLYELIFIRKCIQEDLEQNEICPELDKFNHQISVKFFKGDQKQFEAFQKKRSEVMKKRRCWHLCYFEDIGDNNHPGVREVAYRLNQVVAKTLAPKAGGFTHEELSHHAEREIKFLKAHYQKGLEEMAKLRKGIKIDSIANCNTPGPTTNFGYESTRGAIKPMGIRDEKDAQIIRDAITLDCSQVAQRAFILYRGADFERDSVSCWGDKEIPYSLSFGSSLFAGCLFDGGATAFHYMRNGKNAYAIPVPFDQINSSPFFIPSSNTLAQLFCNGEVFHGRTKAWKNFDINAIGGINWGANSRKRDHLKSNLSKEELITQFQNYKKEAIQLK